ncbi:hypothetical protein X474_01135 [Dethiosulfatarculus sandiegensis]|uniref:Uncharacterized protein n=1 Tax=Dethiosulfatarculus sandiegensis TaxID=1429043 RepID=A0A0D2JD18_9BACT|nr:hypothetical protein X474_01135 [Dethiosulfatarculus sandiegensis]
MPVVFSRFLKGGKTPLKAFCALFQGDGAFEDAKKIEL